MSGANSFAFTEYKEGGETKKNYKVRGMGETKCSDFLKEAANKKGGGYAQYMSWTDGYLTAHNAFAPNTEIIDSKDTGILMWWLGKYCKLRPEDTFSQAVMAMLWELAPQRAPHRALPGGGM